MKKIVSSVMWALILISTIMLTSKVQPVEAEWTGTVYIRADGSIDPPDAPITTYDNVTYALTDNITSSGHGIVVERDNIIIYGADFTVQGGGYGVYLLDRSNVVIKNMKISGFSIGIKIERSSYISVLQNNITTNEDTGISVYSSSNITISENIIAATMFDSVYGTGIYVADSIKNNISRNSIIGNGHGIWLKGSSNISIYENNIIANRHNGLWVQNSNYTNIYKNAFIYDGLCIKGSYENTVRENIVNDKPLFYLEGGSHITIADREVGQILLIRCNNITIQNVNISSTDRAIYLDQTSDTKITKTRLENNSCGVSLKESVNNTISENTLASNDQGLAFVLSSSNLISVNNITNNFQGIYLGWSSSNIFVGNNIRGNEEGIFMISDKFYLNNKFYHNNFIGNTVHLEQFRSYSNVWDDGYPSGGNYWSDYTGVDADEDAIGNTPYTIDAINTDRYPLMAPFHTFDAGVWNGISYNVDVVSNSSVSGFKFDVNQKNVCFNVTGDDGTVGFCRVTIPKELLWVDDGWTITVGNQSITNYLEYEDEKFTYLYFSYNHSAQTVTIQGTHVIREYPPTTLPILLLLTITLTTIINKKSKPKTSHDQASKFLNLSISVS